MKNLEVTSPLLLISSVEVPPLLETFQARLVAAARVQSARHLRHMVLALKLVRYRLPGESSFFSDFLV